MVERADDALEHVHRALRLARRTGQSPLIPGLLVLEANCLLMRGQITEAAAVAETATDAAILTGNDQFAVWALWADAMVCAWTGDTGRALASAREAVARSEAVTQTYFSSLSRLHLAAALSAAGDAAGARAELAAVQAGPAQQLLDLRGGHGWELLIRTQLALGETDAAAAAAQAAEARARATGLGQRAATALCARAAVLLAAGQAEGADRLAREAIAVGERTGNPVLSARARVVLGAALGRGGDPEAAIAELGDGGADARRRAERCARPTRPRRSCDGWAGGDGAHVPPTSATGIAALSPREREVAALVASGKPQPRGRGGAVREREDGREPPRPDLRQARSPFAHGARGGHRQRVRRRAASPRRRRARPGLTRRARRRIRLRDVLAASVQPTGDRRLAGAKRARRLAIGQAEHVDRDHRVAIRRRARWRSPP